MEGKVKSEVQIIMVRRVSMELDTRINQEGGFILHLIIEPYRSMRTQLAWAQRRL